MNFAEYSEERKALTTYPQSIREAAADHAISYTDEKLWRIAYCVVALGECGELQNEFKKFIREDRFKLTPERRQKMLGEIGDILWYCDALASELGTDLDTVAALNIKKLKERAAKRAS